MIYRTYEEALKNLPETETFTNERLMFLKKNIEIKNLFFVPFENTYYLEEISGDTSLMKFLQNICMMICQSGIHII